MRDRRRLTSLITLVGILALVGCASASREYAKSHGYYPVRLNGTTFYCSPRPWIADNASNDSSTAVNCLSLADIENVRAGTRHLPSAAPERAFDIPHGFRRVVIDSQEIFCWHIDRGAEYMWSCAPSLTVAQA